jgi:type IV pilus assembly protein PilX
MEEASHMKAQLNFHLSTGCTAPYQAGLRQRGTALFIALIMLVAMSLMGIALVRSVDTTAVIAGNMAFNQGSLMATDVAVQAASLIAVAKDGSVAGENHDVANNYSATYDPASGFPAQLTASTVNPIENVSGTGNTARYWIERMCLDTGPVTQSGCVREEGRNKPLYRVSARIDGPRGTTSVTQTMIQMPANFVPQHALLTDDCLPISGNPTINGTGGNIHSNECVTISGTTTLTLPTGSVTASTQGNGTTAGQGVFASGHLMIGGTEIDINAYPPEPSPVIDIPSFNPEEAIYRQYADFILRRDCTVINRLHPNPTIYPTIGSVLKTSANANWLGWTCTPGI